MDKGDIEIVEIEGPAPKRKAPAPVTQLTLRHYRKLGYICDVVEKWIPYTHRKRDLYGFIDICALREGELLMVQATGWSNISSRRNKIAGIDASGILTTVPGVRIEIIGWRKGKNGRWECKTEEVLGNHTSG